MTLALTLLAFVAGAWVLGLALVGAVEWCVRHVDVQRAVLDHWEREHGIKDDPE